MTVPIRFRDAFRSYIPFFLSDRPKTPTTPERRNSYRYLWSMIAPLDALTDVLTQGICAWFPGVGTNTALPLIARTRRLQLGEDETTAAFTDRLRKWLQTWRGDLPNGGGAGSQLALAQLVHGYLANAPKVAVVNRAGHWTIMAADGSVTTAQAAFDWDSISNPENATHWWDEWIIIYPDEHNRQKYGTKVWGQGLGFGHDVTRQSWRDLHVILRDWKSAHTYLRAVIWSTDPTLFDPNTPSSLPDGRWGKCHKFVSGVAVASRPDSCRFWEDIS